MKNALARKKSFLISADGNVGILFAAALIPVVVLTGGAVDYGHVLAERAKLQAAADAASIGAAQVGNVTETEKLSIGKKIFSSNLANTSLASLSPTLTLDGNKVTVEAAVSIATPFLNLINIPSMSASAYSTADVASEDVVWTPPPKKVCLLALDPNSDDGIHLQGDNEISYNDCWGHTNSTKPTAINASSNSSSATGAGHCAVGSWSDKLGSFSPVPRSGCKEIPDPFATVGAYETGKTYTPTFTPPAKASTCKAQSLNLKKGTFTLSPGRYCGGINIQAGATVSFEPGIYYIDNGLLNVQAGASASGSNVLFYLEGYHARFSIAGGGVVRLAGRKASSSYQGFLIIMNPNANPMGSSEIQGGGEFALQGMLYAPKQRIEVAGNGDVNGAPIDIFGMVAKDFYFRGNGVFKMQKSSGGEIPDIMATFPDRTLQKTKISQ